MREYLLATGCEVGLEIRASRTTQWDRLACRQIVEVELLDSRVEGAEKNVVAIRRPVKPTHGAADALERQTGPLAGARIPDQESFDASDGRGRQKTRVARHGRWNHHFQAILFAIP